MNNACGVSSVESVCNLSGKQKKSFHLQRTPRNAVLQRHAVEKLHDDERLTFVPADFMNGADIWMVQGRRSASLSTETLQRLRVLRNFLREKFESDEASKLGVFGFIDNTHTTAAELLHDAVVRDRLADHWAEILGWKVEQVNESWGVGGALAGQLAKYRHYTHEPSQTAGFRPKMGESDILN
jgi:hypothetical protein